ncbi:MAG TPA: hypothetical protein VL147_21055 [Devosia sp.]|nr:hypothetical protein [Devosia sp.]
MANSDVSERMKIGGDGGYLVAFFRLAVPTLLGAILAYAVAISDAQKEQGRTLNTVDARVQVIVQKNQDWDSRLSKVEQLLTDQGKTLNDHGNRLTAIEARRLQ